MSHPLTDPNPRLGALRCLTLRLWTLPFSNQMPHAELVPPVLSAIAFRNGCSKHYRLYRRLI